MIAHWQYGSEHVISQTIITPQTLPILEILGSQVYTEIPDEKRVQSQKTEVVGGQEGFFVGYTSENIYRVYFLDGRRIETVRDLAFDLAFDEYNYIEETQQNTGGRASFLFS